MGVFLSLLDLHCCGVHKIAELYEFKVWYSNPFSNICAKKFVTRFIVHWKESICFCKHQLSQLISGGFVTSFRTCSSGICDESCSLFRLSLCFHSLLEINLKKLSFCSVNELSLLYSFLATTDTMVEVETVR